MGVVGSGWMIVGVDGERRKPFELGVGFGVGSRSVAEIGGDEG